MRAVIGQVRVERLISSSSRDQRGNSVRSYAAPELIDVYAIYPRTSLEPDAHGRKPVVTGMTVVATIAAKGKVSASDLVTLPDGTVYAVDGRPGVWENNPHARTRVHECVQIELKLSEG